jgi:hypothetical protein
MNTNNVRPGHNLSLNRNDLNAMLDSNPVAVERAILRLDALQTASERATRSTSLRNHVGFSQSWAGFGSSIAAQIRKGYRLSFKQMAVARKCAKFHGNQLVEFATATGRFSPATGSIVL